MATRKHVVLVCVLGRFAATIAILLAPSDHAVRGQEPLKVIRGALEEAEADFKKLEEKVKASSAKYKVRFTKVYQSVSTLKHSVLASSELLRKIPAKERALREEEAFRFAARAFTGSRIPKDARVRGKKWPEAAAPILKGGRTNPDPTASSFDLRMENAVTPVREYLDNTGQCNCGSCWCFAAVAAFESSYLIQTTVKPEDLDVSEQYILDCGENGGCDGDWYGTAWDFMIEKGTATGKEVPYQATDGGECPKGVKPRYFVDSYRLVDPNKGIPDRANIKSALCKYGALAIAVYADDGFDGYGSDDGSDPGVYSGFPSTANPSDDDVNHDITLIGWDDDKNAWLIKNSYGTDWGDMGYMWIDYESNNVGYFAAWVKAKAP